MLSFYTGKDSRSAEGLGLRYTYKKHDRYSQLFHVPCFDVRALPLFLWLTECNGVVRSCVMLSRRTIFYGGIARTTGGFAHTTEQGNCLFKVMGQETCH